MRFLLDRNICIYMIKQKPRAFKDSRLKLGKLGTMNVPVSTGVGDRISARYQTAIASNLKSK